MMPYVFYLFLLAFIDILIDIYALVELRQMISGLGLRQVAFVFCQ